MQAETFVNSGLADRDGSNPIPVEAEVRLLLARPPYGIAAEHRVTQQLAAAMRSASLDVRMEGLSYWTDAAVLGAAQIPTVLFGPRGQGLHSTSESVVIEDLEVCRQVLARFATDAGGPR